MLDIKLIRDNPQLVRKNLERRGNPKYLTLFDELMECDQKWRQTLKELNNLRCERNDINVQIAK
ncbi:MAG: serine--tRNA ligase, partial [Candidatus Bathyarchaeia archaeon]